MWWFSAPLKFRHLVHPKRFAILEACLIGLVSGLAAILLQSGIGWLGGWRIQLGAVSPWNFPVIGLVGGGLAGWLVERFAPDANGSGVPQVKAAMAKFPIALDGQVAWVKLLSSITALGSGLTLGRQGPTVQLGAALAAQFSYWFPTAPDHRRQIIAAGAGAGLAAGFHAPIAGVLFIIEELLHDVSGLTLGTAILSTFIGAVVAQEWGDQSLFIYLGQVASDTSFSVPELPFYIGLGALAGLLGALFNRGLLLSVALSESWLKVGLPWRVGLAGGLCGLIISFLPTLFQDNAGLRILLGSGTASWQLAALAFAVQFGLTLIAYGSGAPGGLFAPSLVLGAALGNLVGLLEIHWLGAGLPITYALVGMGAFFGAVSRVPVTGIVIIFEMTRDFDVVLPLMISSVVAYLVAEKVSKGSVYDLLLQRQGIDLNGQTPTTQDMLDTLTAEDIMQRRVETLPSDMSLKKVVQVFSRTHHRGFPIVEQGRLVGIVTQTDLTSFVKRQLNDQTLLREVMTPHPLTVNPTATLTEVLYVLNRSKISRLPVTEGRKLVGIITRADIIRAESDQVTGEAHQQGATTLPSYGVYQTQGPATGQGRLLIPVANPEMTDILLRLAITIANNRNYEVECLQVIQVPRNQLPSEAPVQPQKSQRLLQRAVRLGRRHRISIHSQIRVAHDVAQAILETERQRHIDLILMGWQGAPFRTSQIIGDTVGTVMRQAARDVILVKPSPRFSPETMQRWLVAVSEGPNVQQAIQLLPAMTAISQFPELQLCQIYAPHQDVPNPKGLKRYADFLHHRISSPVKCTQICSHNVADAIVDLARKERFDVIVVGASQENALKQVLTGSIPEVIAQESDCTVILFHGASTPEIS